MAGAARWTVLVPLWRTTVVVRFFVQGLFESPGRHSHTVEEDEDVVVAAAADRDAAICVAPTSPITRTRAIASSRVHRKLIRRVLIGPD